MIIVTQFVDVKTQQLDFIDAKIGIISNFIKSFREILL